MEVLVSKGFVVVAQNTDNVDYVRQAYALALSIKYSQPVVNNVSIITNDIVPETYKPIFDNIIPIPWDDSASLSTWKVENRWKVYHATPYDETIVLDTDMLVLSDISRWWDFCSNYDLHFCSTVKNYKSEQIVTDPVHRKTFIENNLPNVYYGLHYFKKSDAALEFYKVLEFVCKNWEHCYGLLAPKSYQNWLSMDVSAALAIQITGHQVASMISPFEFIHMKPPLQGWSIIPSDWRYAVHYSFSNNGCLYIGNLKQTPIIHYIEKDFVTPYILDILEALNG
jgi:hypothetical protein